MDEHDSDPRYFSPHEDEGGEHDYSRTSLSGERERRPDFWENLGFSNRAMLWRALGGIFIILALLILGLTVWRFVSSSKKDLIPVIAPPAGPLRERPADPGGLQIMSDDFGTIGEQKGENVRLAPPPEAPDRRLLEEQHEAVERHRLEEEKRAALQREKEKKALEEAQKREERKREEQEALRHKRQQQAEERSAAQAKAAKKAANQNVSSGFDLDSRISHLAVRDHASSSSQTSKSIPSAGHWQVQFAAYSSKQDAMAKWKMFLAKDAESFQGHRPVMTEVLKNGHVFVRLRTDGFRSAAEAKRFCNQVNQSGIPCNPIG